MPAVLRREALLMQTSFLEKRYVMDTECQDFVRVKEPLGKQYYLECYPAALLVAIVAVLR